MKKLPKTLLSKKFIFLAFIFIFLFVFASHVSAYVPGGGSSGGGGASGSWTESTPPYTQQFIDGLKSPSYEKSSFDFTTINNVMDSITLGIIGSDDEALNSQLGSSAIQSTSNLVAGLYVNQPASTRQYLAYLSRNFSIVKPALAQGIAFGGLDPILGIWRSFRNLAYALFAIVLIIIGFTVMFRVKINPQTVVTIQNALPKIVVALIMVTFSYALAGLLIDLTYVIINLFIGFLGTTSFDLTKPVFFLARDMFGGETAGFTIGAIITEFTRDLLPLFLKSLGALAGGIGGLVISVALLFSVFKIFFSLIMAYISIIAGVIFSPLILMTEALPGQKGLINWLKMMLTNLVPFIIVAVLFAIGQKIIIGVRAGGSLWVAPFLGVGNTGPNLAALIGFALILATPAAIASVQKAIGTPGIAGMAGGIVAPISEGWGRIRAAGTLAYQQAKQGYDNRPAKQSQRIYKEEEMRFNARREQRAKRRGTSV